MTGDTAATRHLDQRGFTLIEMVVVMATIALLLALALPNYMAILERGKEQVLQQNLTQLREALDKHYGDTGKYPDRLEELVTKRYLRALPLDPFTESASWMPLPPKEPSLGGVADVASTMTDRDGQPRAAPSTSAPSHSGARSAVHEEERALVAPGIGKDAGVPAGDESPRGVQR